MAVRRVIFKRLLEGDKDKLRREGAKATTGGGAMDLRFNPWDEFEPIVRQMLPNTEVKSSRRKLDDNKWIPHDVDVHIGTIRDPDQPNLAPEPLEFWPEAGKRDFEGRIATPGKLRPFRPEALPNAGEGEIFALVWEDESGLWGAFVTEDALRDPNENWHSLLRKTILDALDEAQAWEQDHPTSPLRNVRGYVDLEHGTRRAFVGRRVL